LTKPITVQVHKKLIPRIMEIAWIKRVC
jgi:hypothetical protein